ncbi:hypothetical protein RHGRI_010752 [Rhododendron griersonianum]|nr:hypothetical protein RHGRI_010752 [Rhododendron griersonianum]KAG5552760.1 hypothetical protein RHGRI_010752 [Rhododendron griersonianum]
MALVATAHGVTIENLTMNPSLEMLDGGIQSVTLGDEEASRRGVQKTIPLERKGPSTFSCGVEIISKTEKQQSMLFFLVAAQTMKFAGWNQGSEAKTAEGKPFI